MMPMMAAPTNVLPRHANYHNACFTNKHRKQTHTHIHTQWHGTHERAPG